MNPEPTLENCDDRSEIGHYRLIRKIGRGGMGIVYLALDTRLNRKVAIKILPPELAGREGVKTRFAREASAISQVEHANIVPIYEIGEHDGSPYIVMRYVEGTSLLEWCRNACRGAGDAAAQSPTGAPTEGAVAPTDSATLDSAVTEVAAPPAVATRLLEIGEMTADALEHAHRHGIVHRDVKPSNIVVDDRDRPHLLDFGLATLQGVDPLTSPGKILGTLPYMAPEQVNPRGTPTDHRVDIYGLGVTLFECLCGRRPFVAETNEALAFQIVMKAPPSPRDIAPELSRDVETVLMKCLEKDPNRRYPTAAELADDLRRLRQHRAIQARPIGRLGKIVRWAELNRKLAVMSALLFLLAIIVPSVLVTTWVRESRNAALLERYRLHLDRAKTLEEERARILQRLDLSRRAFADLADKTPRHLPPSDPAKIALYEARAEIERLERRAEELEGAMEFELQRSRESMDPEGPVEERVAFYRDLYLRAERSGQRAAMEKYRLFLAQAGAAATVAPRGRLTLHTAPQGAYVTAYPCSTALDGRIQPDVRQGVDLGETPIRDRELPAGLWMLQVRKRGFMPLKYPVFIERGETWGAPSWHGGQFREKDWTVVLSPEGAFDEAIWARVTRGPYQATPEFFTGLNPPTEWRWVDDFLIARKEVTFGEYVEFLNTPETRREILEYFGEKRRFKLVPRETEYSDPMINVDSEARLRLAETEWYHPDIPLVAVSHRDITEFLVWLRAKRGNPNLRLPRVREWEKAARGVDGRPYPWGRVFDFAFTSGRYSVPAGDAWEHFPRLAGRFAIDTSPYGVQDMAGNVSEWCADSSEQDEFGDTFWSMGGSFGAASPVFFTCWPRNLLPYDALSKVQGFRLARDLP